MCIVTKRTGPVEAALAPPERKTGSQLLRIPEVAERLGCSARHIYNLINAGHIGTVDVGLTGPRTRVSEMELDRYVHRSTTKARRTA